MAAVAEPQTVKDMKDFLSARGISFAGCLEKQEFAELVKKAIADGVEPLPKPLPKYPLVDLLGPTLVNHQGEEIATTSLRGKTVGLYFSASWCPPCQKFTPALSQVYQKLAASNPGEFEIVFVSSDRDQMSYTGYYGKMPWLSLPFEKRELAAKASAANKVRGIPALILYNAEGRVYQTDGYGEVLQYPDGFPWD